MNRIQLHEIAHVKYGKAKPKTQGAIPVVGSGGVYSQCADALINYETLVVGRKGTAGMVWHLTEPCWPADTAFYLEWKTKVNVPFIYAAMLHKPLSGEHARTTMPSLQKPDLENFSFYFPEPAEQQAIARVLHGVQAAKEARERELTLERERKAALMQHLFTHGTHGERRKQTPIGEIPESWDILGVGEVASVKGGKRLPKGRQLTKEKTSQPYIRVSDMADSSISLEDIHYVPIDIQEGIKRYIITQNDIYISIAGSIGFVGIIPPELDGANLTENAARLIIKTAENYNQRYLMYALQNQFSQDQIQRFTTKNAQPKLALARIQAIKAPFPNIHEQKIIADLLDAQERVINKMKREISIHSELFYTLLDGLMSGQIPVTPLLEKSQEAA